MELGLAARGNGQQSFILSGHYPTGISNTKGVEDSNWPKQLATSALAVQ